MDGPTMRGSPARQALSVVKQLGAIGFDVDAIGIPAILVLDVDFAPESDMPSHNDIANSIPIPVALFDRLASAGLDTDAILRSARLPRSKFNVTRPVGTTAEFFALWRAVEDLSDGDPRLGLRIGVEALPDDENVVSLAAMHSTTLGEGLQKLVRYKRLVCPERLSIEVRDDEARLRFEWVLATDDPPAILTDIIFASVTNLAQRGTGKQLRPRRIELARPRRNETVLRRHFRCEILFDAPCDLLVFNAADLVLPMRHRNVQLLALITPGLEQAVADGERPSTLADDVHGVLRDTMRGDRPAVSRIAKSLGMSARTMQRRLGKLGTSYQALLDDFRRQSARRLLAKHELGVGEVAFLLGFEEVNSFTRAFRGWEGTTPAKWRARRVTSTSARAPSQNRLAKRSAIRTGRLAFAR